MNMTDKKISELSKSYVQMFEQIRRDVHREKELNIVNFYDLDFFEIFLYITQLDRKKFELRDDILTEKDINNKLILLPPTLFELFKYLENTQNISNYDHITHMETVKNFNKTYRNFLSGTCTLEQLQDAYEKLTPLKNILFEINDTPIGKLYDLLMNGNIIEFAEIENINGKIPKGDMTVYKTVFDELNKHRPFKSINNELDANTAAIVYELDTKYQNYYHFSIVTSSTIFKKVLGKISPLDTDLDISIVSDPLFLYAKSNFLRMVPNASLDDLDKVIYFFRELSTSDNSTLLNNLDIYIVHLIKKLFYIDKRWSNVFLKCLIDDDLMKRSADEFYIKNKFLKPSFEDIELTTETLREHEKYKNEIELATENIKIKVDDIYVRLYEIMRKTSYSSLTPQITDTYNYILKKR